MVQVVVVNIGFVVDVHYCPLIQQSLDVVRDVISRGWLKIKRVFGAFKSIWDDDSQVT
jgi:hypothetical protein